MNKLEIKLVGHPLLREIASPVTDITPDILRTLNEMADMMENAMGVGLAAPQVGISKRFFVMKELVSRDDVGILHKMINPRILSKSDDVAVLEEGCLSVLGIDGPVFAKVSRPESVVVEWTNENGEKRTHEFSGVAARVVQHEIDHLDGILFVDYLSSAKREMLMNKVKKRKV